MTMNSIYNASRKVSVLNGMSEGTIGICMDLRDHSDTIGIVVATDDFIKGVMALGITGLTYEAPLVLPTEPGLYIQKRHAERLEDGPWTFRLAPNGQWSHLNGLEVYSREEMQAKLPLVQLTVKED